MEPFSISKVSKHCGRKLKLTKTITGLPGVGLNENIFIRLNQSVIVLSCQAYSKQSICTSEKIRHYTDSSFKEENDGRKTKAFSGDFFFNLSHFVKIKVQV